MTGRQAIETPVTSGPSLPAWTWDSHVHVLDPARFPYAATQRHRPGPARLEDLRARHRQWGVARCLLVQPDAYGTDNRCLRAALARLGPQARGVAMADPAQLTDGALARMQAEGIVGFRLRLGAGQDTAAFSALAARLRGSDMFVQIDAPLETILAHRAAIDRARLPVVLDHFASIADADLAGPGSAFGQMCRNAPVWVKLSADYRLGQSAGATNAVETRLPALIARLWAMMPDRLLWGSDWPHIAAGDAPFRRVYALSVPDLMVEAGLDNSARRRILALNPARLFDVMPPRHPPFPQPRCTPPEHADRPSRPLQEL